MNRLFNQIELPLIPVIAELEATGYMIDVPFFKNLKTKVSGIKEELETQLCTFAGRELNPASAKDLGKFIYGDLGLPVLEQTPSGNPSTAKETLEYFRDKHPSIALILEHKKASKILSTYSGFPEKVGADSRLRPTYQQLGTVTGRLTASHGIQTIPKDDSFAIRTGFVASEGHTLVAADFDQQEMFVLAGVSGDESLLQAIRDGQDLHGVAAKLVFGLDCQPNDVKSLHKDLRNQVKAIQFGLIYGSSAAAIGKTLGLKESESVELVEAYFSKFPRIRSFIDKCHRSLNERSFVTDLFGRRRVFQKSRSKAEHAKAFRDAQNFPIQSAGAGITKLAMLKTHRHIKANCPGIKMILSLHDELQFEVPNSEVERFASELPGLMTGLGLEAFDFHVPMKVEVRVGKNWGSLSSVEGLGVGCAN